MVLAHLDDHRSEVGAKWRRIVLSWKPCPMPGLQVKHIHVDVRVNTCVAWRIDQHKGLVLYDTHATAEFRGQQAPRWLPVLPSLLSDVKAPQSLFRLNPVAGQPPSKFTCTLASGYDKRMSYTHQLKLLSSRSEVVHCNILCSFSTCHGSAADVCVMSDMPVWMACKQEDGAHLQTAAKSCHMC